MLRRIGVLFCLLALYLTIPAAAVSTSASSAILVEASTGRVLYAQNAEEPRPIASITKLMTALLVTERTEDLSSAVTILQEDTASWGSSMYLVPGEEYTVEELLYGLLLVSGNDAALALARVCAGQVDTFVSWMNDRAAELGMENSQFSCPNGLIDEGNYSTAKDMALLAAACLQQPVLAEIMATKYATVHGQTLTNHNKLLWQYEGCCGMKTGYTEAAGRTLVSCAQKDGMTLIAVTLNDGNDWTDHKALFDFGFETYQMRTLCTQGECLAQTAVPGSLVPLCGLTAGETVRYPMTREEAVECRCTLDRVSEAPVCQGQQAGRVSYLLNGCVVAEADLVYQSDRQRDLYEKNQAPGFWEKLLELLPG